MNKSCRHWALYLLIAFFPAGIHAQATDDKCELEIINNFSEAITVVLDSGNGIERKVGTGKHGFDFAPNESVTVFIPIGEYTISMYSKKTKGLLRTSEKIKVTRVRNVALLFVCSDKTLPCEYKIEIKKKTVDPEIVVKFSTSMFPGTCNDSFFIARKDNGYPLPIRQYWVDATSLILYPSKDLDPDVEYLVGCANLNPVNSFGELVSGLPSVSFKTGNTSRSLTGITGLKKNWSGTVLTLTWEQVAGADGYLVHDMTREKTFVDVTENKWTRDFSSIYNDTIPVRITPYYLNDEYNRVFSEFVTEKGFENMPIKKKNMKESFPIGGVMIGVAYRASSDKMELNEPIGIDVEFQVPLRTEFLGAYADTQWCPFESDKTVSGSAGLRACLPLRNHFFRFEPFFEGGYFMEYNAESDSPIWKNLTQDRFFHGPEVSLGVRANARFLGVFIKLNERIQGLYDNDPVMQPSVSMGIDWSFIQAYW